jgi:hypothetical protein
MEDTSFTRVFQEAEKRVEIPVAAQLGAHQPDRRLSVEGQGVRPGQIRATPHPKPGLACFIVRFLTGSLDASLIGQHPTGKGYSIRPGQTPVPRTSVIRLRHARLCRADRSLP